MSKLIISKAERLPTIEIMGKEYPYDVSDPDTISKLQEIAGSIEGTSDSVVESVKKFFTLFFCDNSEPADRIETEYKKSGVLWLDALGQLQPFVENINIKSVKERIGSLKKASDDE